ncbi:MAG: hypothetical protein WKG00_15275 [Polyangiaceae bacterium]
MTSRRRRALLGTVLALPLLALVELALHLWFAARPPAFDDWRALAAPVAELRQDGDLCVVAPPWAEPLARAALGDRSSRCATWPAATARRTARPSRSPSSASGPPTWRPGARRRAASRKFLLRRLENPAPTPVVFDFTEHVRPPLVSVGQVTPDAEPDAPPRSLDCAFEERAAVLAGGLGGHPTFPPQRFVCSRKNPFYNVSTTVVAAGEGFLPRRCIWAPPPPAGRGELRIRFSGVPLGQVIQGHSGMYWILERMRAGAEVTLVARVDGEEVGRVTHLDGQGWAPFSFPLGAHAGAERADVELAVSSPDPSARHFCFEADSR